MSAASRARQAAREAEAQEKRLAYWRGLMESNQRGLAQWYADQGVSPEQREATRIARIEGWGGDTTAFPYEPIPHWVLPIGESLVRTDAFWPPTQGDDPTKAILSVRAFHHSLDPREGVLFERAAVGERWMRVA